MAADAAEFIMTEASKYDPAFGPRNIVFSQQRAEFGPRKPFHDFQEAVQRYQASGQKPVLALDPATCTWNDIVEAFDAARATYDKKAQGFRGITRKVFRSAGNNASQVTSALDILPDETMVNALKAGLVFIVTLAEKASKKRDAILTAFADIPLQFGLAEKKRRRFPENAALKKLSLELHDALMVAIPKLISHLLPEKRLSFFPRINTPGEEDIEEILETVRQPYEALKQQVQDILEEILLDLSRTSNVIRDTSLKTYATLQTTSQKMDDWRRDSRERFDELKASNSEVQVSNDEVMASNAEVLASNDEVKALNAAVINAFTNNTLLSTLVDTTHSIPPWLHGGLLVARTTGISYMRLEELVHSLHASVHDLLVKDLETAFSQGKILEREVQAQSDSLLRSPQFQRWYYSEERDVLLVDGGMAETGVPTSTITPLSSICATLAAAARILPNTTPLVFFCGLHTSDSDPLSGPTGLVRALIRMVIYEIQDAGNIPNLDFINTPQFAPALRAHDLTTLCSALRELIYQLDPLTKLYCVIDGITWCERREWAEGLSEVVETLVSVGGDNGRGPVLKLLVTCPVRSQVVVFNFPFNHQQHQFILLSPQGYESEFDPERVMELEMRKWQAERQRSTATQELDEEEDYC